MNLSPLADVALNRGGGVSVQKESAALAVALFNRYGNTVQLSNAGVLIDEDGDPIAVAPAAIDTDSTFAANSDSLVPSQKAVKTAIDGLVNAAPGALNTLKELADALGDDANFATTITTALALKQRIAYAAKTTTYTAVSGDRLLANTTGAAFTITLPASPTVGDTVEIGDAQGTWASNNLTIARNSQLIDGNAGNLIGDINGLQLTLVFAGGAKGWAVYGR